MSVCPFFGRNEDACDVGVEYISPHDAAAISQFCSSRYAKCEKFRELSLRNVPMPNATLSRRSPPRQRRAPEKSPAPIQIAFRNKWPLSFRLRYVSAQCLALNLTREERINMTTQATRHLGWRVALAGTGINLALGFLYAYSMLKADISQMFSGASDPYATACLVFALCMIFGGKLQDKAGPRLTAILGGLLVGAGFIVCSQSSSYWGWVLGFGVLAGAGFGFGYSAATPPALKWFSPAKTGLIAGIVVSGFGIAPVYLAPLCKYLLGGYGLHQTMLILGIAFIAIVCGMALLVVNPPADYLPAGMPASGTAKKAATEDKAPSAMLKEGRFYTLWFTYFIGAGAGLMVIGSIAGLAKQSMGELAFIAVAVMAIGNASGRIVAGVLSDKIGRAATLTIMLVFQAGLMFAAIPLITSGDSSALLVTLLASFIGFNYGTNLSLFPSFAKDYWGSKNYGLNYGILFSAWGLGAFALVRISDLLKAKTGSMETSFVVAGVLLLVGAMMAVSLRPKKVAVEVPASVVVEDEELALQEARN